MKNNAISTGESVQNDLEWREEVAGARVHLERLFL